MNETLQESIVFYIEDEIDISQVLKKMLQTVFPNLHTFENPKSALEMIENNVIRHLIITDITLPCMTGIELIEIVREKNIDSQVILTSGNSQEEYQEAIDRLNIFGYLQKPINIIELMKLSQDAIIKKKANQL